MPKRAQEEYEADDGFVEDAPQSKKSKKGGSEKQPVNTETQEDDDGNAFWQLSKMRRVGISNYKGATLVNLREFYEKDGKVLPGKKGISLSMDQFTAFLEVLPKIESALKAKGVDVPRPKYDKAAAGASVKAEADGDEENGVGESKEEPDEKPAKSKLDKFKHRANHEETSDEDD